MVARQNQINGWSARNPVMAPFLTGLITRRPTLMLGLSAQDSNIQNLFAEAQATMAWPWPSNPPAYVFSEISMGIDHPGLLQNVYHLNSGRPTVQPWSPKRSFKPMPNRFSPPCC